MNPQFSKSGQDPKAIPGRASAELEVEGFGKFPVSQIATIGRAPESHVVVDARSVSRNHARIFYEGGHYWIKDLDSANGTSVNGKKVKLQMLADQDKIRFGDAMAIFRTTERSSGPAPLAKDPLAGSENAIPDGTPTGGLGDPFSLREGKSTGGASTVQALTPGGTEIVMLTRKIESLQSENELLRREVAQYRSTSVGNWTSAAAPPEQGEIERLRSLVSRLERALADSNVRMRNLQQRLEERK